MSSRIVPPAEWKHARLALQQKEEELARQSEEVIKLRANMPRTRITEEYAFTGSDGPVMLQDMFEGRSQLVVYHAMFAPQWDNACRSCSFLIDQLPRHLGFLNARHTTLALVSRAPYTKLAAHRRRMDWTVPWYSSEGSMFSYDFDATHDEQIRPVQHDFRNREELEARSEGNMAKGDVPGLSVFVRGTEGEVYHTYSTFGEALGSVLTSYAILDFTPLGKQEGDAQPGGGKYHDEY